MTDQSTPQVVTETRTDTLGGYLITRCTEYPYGAWTLVEEETEERLPNGKIARGFSQHMRPAPEASAQSDAEASAQ